MRWLKRWWARVTHKHEWVVIERGKVSGTTKCLRSGQVEEWIQPWQLQRCTCGLERARRWDGNHWAALDMDWVNHQIATKGWDIPARHQE